MTTAISPCPKLSFSDSNGNPLSGGKLFTYAAGTTTKQTTYTDSTGSTPNTNPIILDSRGECSIWLTPTLGYKFTLSNATDTDPPTNPIWTQDNLAGPMTAIVASPALVVSNIAALRAVVKTGPGTVLVAGYYAPADGGGGPYSYDPTDTTSADNGGSIIVAADGGRWKLDWRQRLHIRQFGAKCDGSTYDSAAVVAALSVGKGYEVWYDGNPKIGSKITVPVNTTIKSGAIISDANPASYFVKDAAMTTVAIELLAGSKMEGGGIQCTAGSTGGAVQLTEAFGIMRDVHIFGPGGSANGTGNGIRVGNETGGELASANSFLLENVQVAGMGGKGFLFRSNPGGPANANGGTIIRCSSNTNGSDGFASDNAYLNTFIGCTAEGNTGRGFVDGPDNAADTIPGGVYGNQLIGGDFEGNNGGDVNSQIVINPTSAGCLVTQNNQLQDKGFRTRNLGTYVQLRGPFFSGIYGATPGGGSQGTVISVTTVGQSAGSIKVTWTAHSLTAGQDYVYIPHPINANVNGCFLVKSVVDANNFVIDYRSDASSFIPSGTDNTSVLSYKLGKYTLNQGYYRLTDGWIEFDVRLTISDKTNFGTGGVMVILPFPSANVGGYFTVDVPAFGGVTFTGIGLLIGGQYNGYKNHNIYENIGSGLTPAVWDTSKITTPATVHISGRYAVPNINGV